MITGSFIETCIFITAISISYFFFKDKDVNKNKSLRIKVENGICSGLLGIVVALCDIHITHSVVIDLSTLAILLSALYGGFIPAIISSLIICTFNIVAFPISKGSIVSVIVILLIGIGFSSINLITKKRKNKWIYCIIYLMIMDLIMVTISTQKFMLLSESFQSSCFLVLFVAYILFNYTEYLSKTVKSYEILEKQATVDFLTGVNNVRQFKYDFNNFMQQTIRRREKLSLLYLDIDYFKRINDTYGHGSGDLVLKYLAEILCSTCRGFDIISRNGGEEFSVLLLDCSSTHAVRIAERIRKNVEDKNFYISNGATINVTISIGVSTYPDTTNNIDRLLEYADIALYEAKRTGRNKVVLYSTVA